MFIIRRIRSLRAPGIDAGGAAAGSLRNGLPAESHRYHVLADAPVSGLPQGQPETWGNEIEQWERDLRRGRAECDRG